MKPILTFILSIISLVFCHAQSHAILDSTFGVNGKVVTSLPHYYYGTEATRLIELPNGKILAWGNHYIVRYMPNGELDSSFGSDGILDTAQLGSSFISFLSVGPADEIVISGYWFSDSGEVRKFMPNGVVDSSFGNNGIIKKLAWVSGILPNGEILCTYRKDTNSSYTLLRFNPDGSMDASDTAFTDSLSKMAEIKPSGNTTYLKILQNGDIITYGYFNPSSGYYPLIIQSNSGHCYRITVIPGAGGYNQNFRLLSFSVFDDQSLRLQFMEEYWNDYPDPGGPGYVHYRGTDSNGFPDPYFYAMQTGIIWNSHRDMVTTTHNIAFVINRTHLIQLNKYAQVDSTCFKPTPLGFRANKLLIDKNNKILVAGGSNNEIVLARYLQPCNWIGLEEPQLSVDVLVYPNPASNYITIENLRQPFDANSEVVLYDLLGNKLLQKHFGEAGNTYQLHVGYLKAGVYILQVVNEDDVLITERVIIQ